MKEHRMKFIFHAFILLIFLSFATSLDSQNPPNTDDNIEYQNHYDVLQVDNSASMSEIKKAYRKLAVQWHPDKHSNSEDKEQATKVFQAIGRAYEVLSDEGKRKTFDDDLYFGNIGDSNQQNRDPRAHGNIWEQLRRERLRKQEARKNSFMGKFDNALTYIIPIFFCFGALNLYMNTSPENGHSNNDTDSANSNNKNSEKQNENQESKKTEPEKRSLHYKQALKMAPSLVQLDATHFHLSTFLIIVVVNGENSESVPWEKLNNLAKSRRSDRSLSFTWVDLHELGSSELLKINLIKWYPNILNHGGDWSLVACRPTKVKGTSYLDTENVNFEKLGFWLDGLTDGSTKMCKFDV
jgi:curved DNA-binding protein CbpA